MGLRSLLVFIVFPFPRNLSRTYPWPQHGMQCIRPLRSILVWHQRHIDCLVFFFVSAFVQCIYSAAGQTQCAKSFKKHDQFSLLGKTIDSLIIGDNF